MKIKSFIICTATVLSLCSCSGGQQLYLESFTPEESGLNLIKISDESSISVLAGAQGKGWTYNPQNVRKGYSDKYKFNWIPNKLLDISPDGTKLAYATRMNGQNNIMIRSTKSQGTSTQRTFRDVQSFCWGGDNKLYFSDANSTNCYIFSINAEQGSMMNQLTNGAVYDMDPVTLDGKMVYFTRSGNLGPSIWSLDRSNGTLTSCAKGYNPCLIPNDPEAFYCVRNSSNGRSEIWYVNYVKGQESLILSDTEHSFTNPALSPDGKWLAMQGNAISSIDKKANLDIFVVRTDGTQLTQLTYNPNADLCPVWAKDGRSIFFISSRANKNMSYNIWRMNFNLE